MYKKYTSNSYIYTKKIYKLQNLYKVQTKNGFKLEMFVFCTNSTKPIQFKQQPETAFVCFLYTETMHKLYKTYTNVNWIIYSATDVWFFVYAKTPHSLLLKFTSTIMVPSSVLFCNFGKCQDQSFYFQKGSQMNLYYRFI